MIDLQYVLLPPYISIALDNEDEAPTMEETRLLNPSTEPSSVWGKVGVSGTSDGRRTEKTISYKTSDT